MLLVDIWLAGRCFAECDVREADDLDRRRWLHTEEDTKSSSRLFHRARDCVTLLLRPARRETSGTRDRERDGAVEKMTEPFSPSNPTLTEDYGDDSKYLESTNRTDREYTPFPGSGRSSAPDRLFAVSSPRCTAKHQFGV